METTMKALMFAAAAIAALAATADSALAQYGPSVPITRNWRGEPACPSNYVIRGGACVSIYAGRRGYHDGYSDSYAGPGRRAVRPVMNDRGLWQCPSNYVIRGGLCVSLY
jgi:hypothetical protein